MIKYERCFVSPSSPMPTVSLDHLPHVVSHSQPVKRAKVRIPDIGRAQPLTTASLDYMPNVVRRAQPLTTTPLDYIPDVLRRSQVSRRNVQPESLESTTTPQPKNTTIYLPPSLEKKTIGTNSLCRFLLKLKTSVTPVHTDNSRPAIPVIHLPRGEE